MDASGWMFPVDSPLMRVELMVDSIKAKELNSKPWPAYLSWKDQCAGFANIILMSLTENFIYYRICISTKNDRRVQVDTVQPRPADQKKEITCNSIVKQLLQDLKENIS